LLTEYRGHLKTIWSVSFSKSGYFFLSGSADKTIKLWSTDDSIAQRVFIGHHLDVIKVNFMENPDFIISSSEDKTLKIWNTLTT
jgi:transcription initiation factor TFIID subunit 5